MEMHPADLPPDPDGKRHSIGWASLALLEATAVMCGAGLLTHDEHAEIVAVAENAAQRYLKMRKLLEELDFEP
jgi:hypothetical protein